MRLPARSSSRALLFGTSGYTHLVDLPAVRNNLDALGAFLTSTEGTGLAADDCVLLPDPDEIATVGAHLETAAQQAEDTLLVYYAGHGLVDQRGELYLSLPGTSRDLLRWTGLPFDAVREVLAHARARNRVLILDCCFSGRAIEAMSDPDSVVSGQIGIDGTYTLASAPRNHTSNAPVGARYTAFTGELLGLLEQGVPDEAELLTLGTLYRALRHTLTSRGLHAPQQRGTQTADLLALARNPAYRPPEPVAPPEPAVSPEETPKQSTEDVPDPLQWYQDAAADGDPKAAVRLAELLESRDDRAGAMSWYRRSAELGEPEGMVGFARLLWGDGEREDAETWYRAAAEREHVAAMTSLGSLLWRARRGDEAVPWFERAAESGDVTAMARLGDYHGSLGASSQAIVWYGRAAEHGDAEAALNEGLLEGISGDPDKALQRFQRAAGQELLPRAEFSELTARLERIDRDESGAQTRSARHDAIRTFAVRTWRRRVASAMLRRDRDAADAGDVEAEVALGAAAEKSDDPRQAERHYLTAAANNSTNGAFRLAVLLERQDRLEEAKQWYVSAAHAGHADAEKRLGQLAEEAGAEQEARRRYESAAASGDTASMVGLGRLAELSGDRERARDWYRRAAEHADPDGMFRFGALRREEGSVGEATRWFKRAADGGHVEAMFQLGAVLLARGETGEAENWFRQALRGGHPEASKALDELLRSRRRARRTRRFLR